MAGRRVMECRARKGQGKYLIHEKHFGVISDKSFLHFLFFCIKINKNDNINFYITPKIFLSISITSSNFLPFAVAADECEPRIFMLKDHKTAGNALQELSNVSVTFCLSACLTDSSCKAAEFKLTDLSCTLTDGDMNTVVAVANTDTYFSYCKGVESTSWNLCIRFSRCFVLLLSYSGKFYLPPSL